MPASPIRYSLIIATLEDDGDLEHCLASLAALEPSPPFEVIVVDQNGDERLVDLLSRFAGQLHIIHERVDFRGVSRARNYGAKRAGGEWLAFPDDDCGYLPGTLNEVERIAADPRIRVITGRTIDDAGKPNSLRWEKKALAFSPWTMFSCLTEPALFIRADTFQAAGGFDEAFGLGGRYPAAEGLELMERVFAVMDLGKAYFDPAIQLRHPTKIPPWNRWAVKRCHDYAVGDGAMIAKYPRPHMLYWGAKRLAASIARVLLFRGWRSIAFAATIAGFARGGLAYLRDDRAARRLARERDRATS